MATITYPSTSTPRVLSAPTVQTRKFWSDSWTTRNHLHPLTAVWQSQPNLPVARLRYRYGVGFRPGDTKSGTIPRLDIQDHFVRIAYAVDDLDNPGTDVTFNWYGVIRVTSETIEGGKDERRGVQTFTAYGLESLLDVPIRKSAGHGKQADPQIYLRGLEFNKDGRNNMTPDDLPGNYRGFAADEFTPTGLKETWNTRQIVRYLVGFHNPTQEDESTVEIDFILTNQTQLPDFDAPIIKTHGVDVRRIMNSLIARQRGLGWTTTVNSSDQVVVTPFTYEPSDFVVDDDTGDSLAANPVQHDLVANNDPSTQMIIRKDTSGTVDVVRVQGRRRRSIFTITDPENTLQRSWTDGEETKYENAASTDPSYPAAAEIDLRRKRNTEARKRDELRDVFAAFQIPIQSIDDTEPWDQLAGGSVIFPAGEQDLTIPVEVYAPDISILPIVPLPAVFDPADFEFLSSADDPSPINSKSDVMRPFVIISIPDEPTRFVQIEKAGAVAGQEQTDNESTSQRRWSASVRVMSNNPIFYVFVSPEQHIIGGPDFTKLPEDGDFGAWDWRKMRATIAVEDDRHAEGTWPNPAVVPATSSLRTLLINAGQDYTKDFLASGTIVGLDTDGDTQLALDAGFINNREADLEKLARVASRQYTRPRVVLEWSTAHLTDAFNIGDMINTVQVDDNTSETIDGVITQIRIDWPIGNDPQAPPNPRMSYRTSFGELDPLRI